MARAGIGPHAVMERGGGVVRLRLRLMGDDRGGRSRNRSRG